MIWVTTSAAMLHPSSASPVPSHATTRPTQDTSRGKLCQTAHFLSHHVPIRPLTLHQAVRRSILEDLAGLEQHDPIEVAQGRKAMGDRNHRSAAHQAAERL